jgi:hypothetical protein
MAEVAVVARRDVFSGWAAGVWHRASKVAAWARAERHAFLARPTAGAFHGETPPADGYLTIVRSTWGRP